jgi:hypothetical protein
VFAIGESFKDGQAAIVASGDMTASAQKFTGATVLGSAAVSSGLVFDATGYKYGEEWSPDPDEENSWNVIAPVDNTWTTIPAGNYQWQKVS